MASSSVSQTAAARNQTASNAPAIAAAAAHSCAVVLLHLWFNNRYGYFRDQFDYISCGNHLAWGYVDQPPLIPLLARISILAIGYSPRAIRFLPALASSLLVFQTALLARELGGRTYAVLLSAHAPSRLCPHPAIYEMGSSLIPVALAQLHAHSHRDRAPMSLFLMMLLAELAAASEYSTGSLTASIRRGVRITQLCALSFILTRSDAQPNAQTDPGA